MTDRRDGAATSDMPAGPWVVVVGMHRSGTSAITGALGALGLNLVSPEDRMDRHESNPEHWESMSIHFHNEDLLGRLGGSWEAPPDLPLGWEERPEIRLAPNPAPLLAAAYPDIGPLVWKDPRVCLLLPYWRPLLPTPLAVVFVWRSPMAVARSLQKRNGLRLTDGVALWERYNRAAIEGLSDLDVYVTDYEAVVDDPRAVLGAVTAWLGSLSQFAVYAGSWDVDRAVSAIADELRHHRSNGEDGLLLAEHRQLIERLSTMRGEHRPWRPGPLSAESGLTTALLEVRRDLHNRTRELSRAQDELHSKQDELDSKQHELDSKQRELDSKQSELDSKQREMEQLSLVVANMRASTSWRITRPLRSLVSVTRSGLRRPADSSTPPQAG